MLQYHQYSMSKLGEMADTTTPKVSSLVPVSELESDSRIFSLKLRISVNIFPIKILDAPCLSQPEPNPNSLKDELDMVVVKKNP